MDTLLWANRPHQSSDQPPVSCRQSCTAPWAVRGFFKNPVRSVPGGLLLLLARCSVRSLGVGLGEASAKQWRDKALEPYLFTHSGEAQRELGLPLGCGLERRKKRASE